MKKYKKNFLLTAITFINIIFLLIFIYILFITKIWVYQDYNFIHLGNKKITTMVLKEDLWLFEDNNFLYYNNEKYNYELEDKLQYEEKFLITLKLKEKPKIIKTDTTFFLLKEKKNIISLIIENWRSK